ncbi:MAG: 4a-hydroxytetrahydrobiopterin dehydratase [Candidatus Kariarchaeaceae archaeon]|jgi:4a-hydroxytetrahydrobiopterin dehydratase
MEEFLTTKWKSTRVDTPPMTAEEAADHRSKLGNGWDVTDGKMLEKTFKFTNFNRALQFTTEVGNFADEKNHHPDIHLAWGKAKVVIWTHRINGLALMDFVWAAHVEKIYQDTYEGLLPS